MNLLECVNCKLVFSDARIDPDVIQEHFETAYKDETYFLLKRKRIFKQISRLADRFCPKNGSVLDVGGAKGHLLAALKIRRNDLSLVLNDISREACDYAEQEYGFHTITGGISKLENIPSRFDVIILSDVIYYEPELRRLWNILPHLLEKNGTIIFRLPNKLFLIRFWQLLSRLISRPKDNEMRDKIRFFNPEHLYVFSRRYLLKRLKSAGFNKVIATPSELLSSSRGDFLHPFIYYLCKTIYILTFRKLIFTPSLLVIARKFSRKEAESIRDKQTPE